MREKGRVIPKLAAKPHRITGIIRLQIDYREPVGIGTDRKADAFENAYQPGRIGGDRRTLSNQTDTSNQNDDDEQEGAATVRRALAISPGSASAASIGGSACQTCAQTEQRTAWPASPILSPSTRNTVSQFGQVRSMQRVLSPCPLFSIHHTGLFEKTDSRNGTGILTPPTDKNMLPSGISRRNSGLAKLKGVIGQQDGATLIIT